MHQKRVSLSKTKTTKVAKSADGDLKFFSLSLNVERDLLQEIKIKL
jgi:hypothetical protein